MTAPKPYRPTADELRAIDEALRQPSETDAELAEYNRTFAALLRAKADRAETIEMRILLLEEAERLDQLAGGLDFGATTDARFDEPRSP